MIFKDNLYSVDTLCSLTDTTAQVRVSLLPESEVFKAHFPGQPIMPGACIVQMVVELFCAWTGREAELVQLTSVKFLREISPAIMTHLEVSLEIRKEEAGRIDLRVSVTSGEAICSKLSLLLQLTHYI